MSEKNKIFFASDFHLGVPTPETSLEREKMLCAWLDEIKDEAKEIYLLGDLFDWWFEHKYTVPKGFVRTLGKLAELSDAGIPITLFTGNHDMWMYGYLEKEIGIKIFKDPVVKEFSGKKFFIGHGDGLGPGDTMYKLMKWFFRSSVCQWMYARLHPNFSMWLGHYLSGKSRIGKGDTDKVYLGDKEYLLQFCREKEKEEHFDYYVFGHRHLPIDVLVGNSSRYVNLGEWVNYRSYAVFDGNELTLKYYKKISADANQNLSTRSQ